MRYLAILEVSQKQAYIFSSNKVRDNIVNSAIIAKVLSTEFLEEVLSEKGYSDEKNMVYSGGGHTILEYDLLETAQENIAVLTSKIYCEFSGLEVFAKIVPFDENATAEENLKTLTSELESKKARRASAFKQGSFGVEAIDATTLDVCAPGAVAYVDATGKRCDINMVTTADDACKTKAWEEIRLDEYNDTAKEFTPDGFLPVYAFSELGGKKNKSNFIAVVHIDGNGMGKRVEDLYHKIEQDHPNASWDEVKKTLREFSESIDADYKNAYQLMAQRVSASISGGSLKGELALKDNSFPVRRIITAGDDICFVTEGRIGIECAKIFIEELSKKKNCVDQKSYTACAGVAIVHQKYPFYRAYELAEVLCSSAKSYGAKLSPSDNGSSICSIDWHIEFGELKDSLSETRKQYETKDGNRLELRPYIISSENELTISENQKFEAVRKLILSLQRELEVYGTGKIKGLREALKAGETAANNYNVFNQMMLQDLFIELGEHGDGVKHSRHFDAIELIDTFLPVEGGND